TKKRGPYLTGKTKKSTYFDKYELSGSFTKAAKGTIKISTFMNKDKLTSDDFVEVLDDMDEKEQNQLNIVERIENLKIELKEQQKILTVTEYNKKCAIYEYLKRLDKNGKGKGKASKKAAQLIFINCILYKARTIQYWVNFWLQNNCLPISRQGKYQKIIRLIDDEDIAEKCYVWIRSQGGITTLLKFKEFVEQELLINSGITKRKPSVRQLQYDG
ncbi:12355_t:CDS:1, partial [Funneliformis geosporum]